MKYILTGTGRCGTGWAAHLLTSAGVPCGHETIFTLGGVMPQAGLDADSSWLAMPHLDHDIAADAEIVHLVREPLACIRSLRWVLYGKRSRFTTFAERHLGTRGTPLEQACRHYVIWNQALREYNRVRVEDGAPALLGALSIKTTRRLDDNRRYNSCTPNDARQLTYSDLPKAWRRSVADLAKEYGYL